MLDLREPHLSATETRSETNIFTTRLTFASVSSYIRSTVEDFKDPEMDVSSDQDIRNQPEEVELRDFSSRPDTHHVGHTGVEPDVSLNWDSLDLAASLQSRR